MNLHFESQSTFNKNNMKRTIEIQIRWLVYFFMGALLVSGITAFPIELELQIANKLLNQGTILGNWIDKVYNGYSLINQQYAFIAYGTDWLAFAHILIAILFFGVAKDPVRNVWIVLFGIIACISIIPLALIAGHTRGIPFFWQCIDMSFGVFGLIPLIMIYLRIQKLQNILIIK